MKTIKPIAVDLKRHSPEEKVFVPRTRRRRRRPGQDGAAMLIVLIVLMMTTAMATMAIHTTVTEIRAAGYSRQAMQTQYLAEGGLIAGIQYVDSTLGPQALCQQYSQTVVGANTVSAPGEATVDRESNLLRITMEDIDARMVPGETVSPVVEMGAVQGPSLGSGSLYIPSVTIDGSDLHRTTHRVAGREQSGRSPFAYYRYVTTARGRLTLGVDVTTAGDERQFHDTAVNARAMVETGPDASCAGTTGG